MLLLWFWFWVLTYFGACCIRLLFVVVFVFCGCSFNSVVLLCLLCVCGLITVLNLDCVLVFGFW